MTATKNYHHEEHEVHEEERGKEAFHDYDCPCNQGKTKLSSHPDFFCAFARCVQYISKNSFQG